MKFFFVTFGAGNKNYHDAVDRLCNQVKKFNIFDEIIGITDKDFVNDDFFIKHKNFILNNKRGYGYWIWKPYIILKIMNEKMNNNDLILFLDAGCELNILGIEKMNEYINLVIKHGNLAMQTNHIEKSWSKMDLINYLNGNEFINCGQIESGIQFYLKNEKNINVLNQIINTCIDDNYHYVNDTKSLLKNDFSFKEHRHDQSILSLIYKKKNMFVIQDETYFAPNWKNGLKYPILALRNKTGESKLNNYF